MYVNSQQYLFQPSLYIILSFDCDYCVNLWICLASFMCVCIWIWTWIIITPLSLSASFAVPVSSQVLSYYVNCTIQLETVCLVFIVIRSRAVNQQTWRAFSTFAVCLCLSAIGMSYSTLVYYFFFTLTLASSQFGIRNFKRDIKWETFTEWKIWNKWDSYLPVDWCPDTHGQTPPSIYICLHAKKKREFNFLVLMHFFLLHWLKQKVMQSMQCITDSTEWAISKTAWYRWYVYTMDRYG